MSNESASSIGSAEVVLPCADLYASLAFFTERLGMRVDAVFPADAPRVAVVSGHGVRLRLDTEASGAPGVLRIATDPVPAQARIEAPDGTRIQFVPLEPPIVIPTLRPAFVLSRLIDADWGVGRAGMRYRDLVPARQGGAFVASHIHIPDGGPVPDYVHYHRVRFQMIFCHRGWVRVVYEDQGEPFVMRAGDCVLQPPQIRHRVLESSDDLEVIEIGCPAEHETLADHDTLLPTDVVRPERAFDGQRFLRHVAEDAVWSAWMESFEARDTGMTVATGGVASAVVVRSSGAPSSAWHEHHRELHFVFVRTGSAELRIAEASHAIAAGDAFVVPQGTRHRLERCSPDLEILVVDLPAEGPAHCERGGE
jgi:mannose-6-phosphate isomerase-like protein (cupin superfamily)